MGVTFLLFNGNEFSEAVIILLANNVALNKINLLRIFNLDPKDTFFYIQNVLKNEER